MTTRITLDEALDRARGMLPSLGLKACYVGEAAARRLAEMAKAVSSGPCLVVSDAHTRAAGGEAVLSALAEAGVATRERIYGPEPMDATMELAEALAEYGKDAACYVGVGSGTISDLAKQAGAAQGKPVLLFATAASMNGYTSGIVALKVNGLKRTLPCPPATGVFAHPEVVASAPGRMAAAGVGDFLSKGSSSSDWRAAHFLRGEDYNEDAMVFYRGVQERVLAAAPQVGQGDPAAVAEVLEALLLSGLSMLVAGSSSPASGGEHLVSHFLDMKHALNGSTNDLHGVQVGVATIHCLRLWETILALDPHALDPATLAAAQPDDEQVRAWIEEDWGPIAKEVWGQWQQKALDRAALRAELQRFKDGYADLCARLREVYLPAATVRDAIAASGGPVTIEETRASVETYRRALTHARFIRSRFTVLDLAAELGIA